MSQTPRILVVEEGETLRSAVRLSLQLAGYEVAEIATCLEALDIVRQEPPDLIVLGLPAALPVRRFFDQLQEIDPRLADRLIVMAGTGSTADGASIGPRALLSKPPRAEELREAVARILEQSPVGA